MYVRSKIYFQLYISRFLQKVKVLPLVYMINETGTGNDSIDHMLICFNLSVNVVERSASGSCISCNLRIEERETLIYVKFRRRRRRLEPIFGGCLITQLPPEPIYCISCFPGRETTNYLSIFLAMSNIQAVGSKMVIQLFEKLPNQAESILLFCFLSNPTNI